jgi:hypothetical protein
MNRRLKTALRIIKKPLTLEQKYPALKRMADILLEAMLRNDKFKKHFADLFVFGRSELLIDEELIKSLSLDHRLQ